MIVKLNGVRAHRKRCMAEVHNGVADLRVIGSEKEGFSLASHKGEKVVLLYINRDWPKQKDAIAHGIKKFGVVARKLKLVA